MSVIFGQSKQLNTISCCRTRCIPASVIFVQRAHSNVVRFNKALIPASVILGQSEQFNIVRLNKFLKASSVIFGQLLQYNLTRFDHLSSYKIDIHEMFL